MQSRNNVVLFFRLLTEQNKAQQVLKKRSHGQTESEAKGSPDQREFLNRAKYRRPTQFRVSSLPECISANTTRQNTKIFFFLFF